MNKSLFALLVLVLASSAAYAAGDNVKQQGSGDEAKHQEMFSKMKQARVDGIQGRIAILQTALSCVNAATNHEQMKSCAQQEHQAMEALKQKQEAAREAMRPAGGRK
ncbi:MAG: hypothetical protein K2P67_08155 [Gallionellaceae bacterium]|nr:hypothetical protein [Gallionellaceae bacterium]